MEGLNTNEYYDDIICPKCKNGYTVCWIKAYGGRCGWWFAQREEMEGGVR